MRRTVFFALLVSIFLAVAPGPVRSELSIPPCEAPCDSLREGLMLRGIAIRLKNDPEQEHAFMAEILAEHPDNDLALRELARTIYHQQGVKASLAMVRKHDLTRAGLEAELPDSAWLFLEGILQYYRNRHQTALTLLEEAAALEPGWYWIDYYILICKIDLLRPDKELQPLLDRLLRHYETRTEVLINLFWETSSYFDPVLSRTILEALEQGPTNGVGRAFLDCTRGIERLKSTECTIGAVESFWHRCVVDHGDLAYVYLFRFIYNIDNMLPLREALVLLDDLAESNPDPDPILLVKAYILGKLGQNEQQLVLLDGLKTPSQFRSFQKIQALNGFMKADELNRLLDDVAFKFGITYFTRLQEDTYKNLGREEEFRKLWTESQQENPASTLLYRLDVLSAESRPLAQALLDSIQSRANSLKQFDTQDFALREASGDTMPLADILNIPDRATASTLLDLATRFALENGLIDRHRKAMELRLDHFAGSLEDIEMILQNAWDTADRDLADRALERATNSLPVGHPKVQYLVLMNTTAFEGLETARTMAATLPTGEWEDPGIQSLFASLYLHYRWWEEAAVPIRQVLDLDPDNNLFRYYQAQLDMAQQRNREAAEILKDLAALFPGKEALISDLLVVKDNVLTLADFPAPGQNSDRVFSRFGWEIGDRKFLENLRLDPAELDTIKDNSILLLKRKSLSLKSTNWYNLRVRMVTQIRTELGAERNRTQIIGFDPGDGVPRILASRILTPDGRILDIPPTEILIRAPKDEKSDVTDSRELVIPMGGITPGAVLDLVYEIEGWTSLLSGSSFQYMLPDASPVMTSIVEIWHAQEQLLKTDIRGEGIENTLDQETGVRRLVARNLPAVQNIPFARSMWDLYPSITLTTFTHWDQAARIYGMRFWPVAQPTEKVTALARELTAEADSRQEKLEALFAFIKNNLDGLTVELGGGRLVPSLPDEVLDRRWGDCKDLSCLLISLLAAVDIEARPVLVATAGMPDPKRDFPNIFSFNHMIVQVTGIAGDLYCDPLNGLGCADNLPVSSGGRLGLHIDPDSGFDLEVVKARHARENGFHIETDAYPQAEGHMRYEVSGIYHGSAADYMRTYLALKDSNATRWLLATSLGYGLKQDCQLLNWEIETEHCDHLTVAATFVDTSWSFPGANVGSLKCTSEAADYWGLPDSEDRKQDVLLVSNYDNVFILRLHETDVWIPDAKISGFKAENDWLKARFKSESRNEDGERWVEIYQEFSAKKKLIPVDEYSDFMAVAIRFKLHSGRAYSFRKIYDEEYLEKIRRYANANPEDLGFIANSVLNILGEDMGGAGQDGLRRREFARELMMPLGESLTDYPLFSLIAATASIVDGKWIRADSLVTAALEKNPDNKDLLDSAAAIKKELGQYQEQQALLLKLSRKEGSMEAAFNLIVTSIALGDEQEVRKQVDRLELMGAPIDSTTTLLMRLQGNYMAHDYEQTGKILTLLEGRLDEEQYASMLAEDLLQSHRYEEALEPYEKLWKKNPTDALHCNNLAWCYVMVGSNLDLAYDLAEASSVMTLDNTSSRHTLATVLARRHEWKKARDIFREAYERDDRPENRLVNGLYLGLCQYSLGKKDDARRIWSEIQDLEGESFWTDALEECRRLDEAGEDLWQAVFLNWENDS